MNKTLKTILIVVLVVGVLIVASLATGKKSVETISLEDYKTISSSNGFVYYGKSENMDLVKYLEEMISTLMMPIPMCIVRIQNLNNKVSSDNLLLKTSISMTNSICRPLNLFGRTQLTANVCSHGKSILLILTHHGNIRARLLPVLPP